MTDTASHRAAPPVQGWIREFPARPDQVGQARKFVALALGGCPVSNDAVLCVSELASNSVIHSASGRPGGAFTVRAEVRRGDYVRVEVHDEGGRLDEHPDTDGRPHGLAIVRELAADSGIEGNELTGWIAWARLEWRAAGASLTDEESALPDAAAQASAASATISIA